MSHNNNRNIHYYACSIIDHGLKRRAFTRSLSNKLFNKTQIKTKERQHNTNKSTIEIKHKSFVPKVNLINKTLPILIPDVPKSMIFKHMQFINHMHKHKGAEYTLRFLKATAEVCEHFMLTPERGQRVQHQFEGISIGLDYDGFPKWLGKRLKRGYQSKSFDKTIVRYVNSLTSVRKFIVVETKTNLESITEPLKVKNEVRTMSICKKIAKHFRRSDRKRFRILEIGQEAFDIKGTRVTQSGVPRLTVSMKNTPNGTGFFSFPWDRAAVAAEPQLVDRLKTYLETNYKGDCNGWLAEMLEPYTPLHTGANTLHTGRISLQHEGGKLKPRVFAIPDSLTQSVLEPLHDDLMDCLRTIPEDCTFDHSKVSRKAQNLFRCGHTEYGFADLSSASDRLKAKLYEFILNKARPGLGTSWVAIFDRDFHLGPSVVKHWTEGETPPSHVRYAAGQPMGALSSWPAMAYVHHHIVWYAAGSRKNAKNKYLILGDDIVIFSKKLYRKYLSVLRVLGLSYTNNFSTVGFEFAKRYFVYGEEVTGAYTRSLWASRTSAEVFALEWSNLATRGYKAGESFPTWFKTFLRLSRKRFYRCLLLVEIPKGDFTDQDLAKWVLSLQGRSTCFLKRGDKDYTVDALCAFRQYAALVLKQGFQKTLNDALADFEVNKKSYKEAYRRYHGVDNDVSESVLDAAHEEYCTSQQLKVRYLERELKNSYLVTDDKVLLRPNRLDIPRRIFIEPKDKQLDKLKFRAEHQLGIISALRYR